jgi:hypothetical protein
VLISFEGVHGVYVNFGWWASSMQHEHCKLVSPAYSLLLSIKSRAMPVVCYY